MARKPVTPKLSELENLTSAQLDTLVAKIEELRDERSKLAEIAQKARKFVEDQGVSWEKVVELASKEHGDSQQPPRAKATKAKYQNPLNTNQVWSGRGKKPAWFVEMLDKGYNPDDLLLKD